MFNLIHDLAHVEVIKQVLQDVVFDARYTQNGCSSSSAACAIGESAQFFLPIGPTRLRNGV